MAENEHTVNLHACWMSGKLRGLSATLEVVLLLQAILHELRSYYEDFERTRMKSQLEARFPLHQLTVLQRSMKRVSRLLKETRQFFADLGDTLIWVGDVRDDLSFDGSVLERLRPLGFTRTIGFDNKNMKESGKTLVHLLRRCQAAIAAVHISTQSLAETMLKNDGLQSSRNEQQQDECLNNLAYWASNDIDRVRTMHRRYTIEIASLYEAAANRVDSRTDPSS